MPPHRHSPPHHISTTPTRVGHLLPSMDRVWFPLNGTCWDTPPTPPDSWG